jgi:subtilase family serine protease
MRPIAIVAASIVLSSAALPAQTQTQTSPSVVPNRIVSTIDNDQLVTLHGNTSPLAIAKNDLGPVSADLPMPDMTLVLSRSPEQQAAFDQYVAGEYGSGSPDYHQWLTPAEIGQHFGPSPADVATIAGWLTSQGFTVTKITSDRMAIRFSGTAGLAESAFHTQIHNLVVKGVPHVGNMTDPSIPAALAPVVVGIKALHNFLPHPMHRGGNAVVFNRELGGWQRVTNAASASSVAASSGFTFASSAAAARAAALNSTGPHPLFGINAPSTSTTSAYLEEDVTPWDFATIYNVTPLWNNNVNGNGQTIAIAGTSDINLADVTTFRGTFGLPAGLTPKEIDTNGLATECTSTSSTAICGIGDLEENSIDVEWSGAVAPGAQIDLVVTGQNAAGTVDSVYDSAQYVVENLTAKILNVSYGECELGNGTAENVAYYDLWQSAAAEGISVFVATGDSGSPSCDQGGDAIGWPYSAQYGLSVSGLASTPFNVAVGGTDFSWCKPTVNSSGNVVGCPSSSTTQASPAYWNTTNNTTTEPYESAAGYVPEIPWNDTCENPILASYLNSVAPVVGVTAPTNAEGACNFVQNNWENIYQQDGVMLAPFVDTAGGSGGASSCVVNTENADPSNPTCSTGATTTGTANGSIALTNNGWQKPSWQTGVTGIPADGVRDLPDVSFFAGDGTLDSAYLFCVSAAGSCSYSATSENTAEEAGGTSFASPAMAGVMALIDQKSGAAQGLPSAQIYKLASQQTYSDCSAEASSSSTSSCYFHSIDEGTSAMPCDLGATIGGATYDSQTGSWVISAGYAGTTSPDCKALNSGDTVGTLVSSGTTPAYNATAGFNVATGLGSLNVANVVNAWASDAGTATATMTITTTPAASSGTITLASGVNLVLAVTVTGSGSLGTPTGSITVSGGGYSATQSLASGAVTITIPAGSLAPGSDTLTVTYSGNSNYASTSQTESVTASAAAPTVTVVAPASDNITNSVYVSVTVSGPSGGSVPTGTVTLTGGSYSSTAATLSSTGTATFTIPAGQLPAGTDTLTSTYSGNSSYAGATGITTVVIVSTGTATPTIKVTPSPTSIDTSGSLSVTVTVSGSSAVPTGYVTLTSGSYNSGLTAISGGSATFTIPANTLSAGTDTLTAVYSGDAVYAGVTGTATVTVTQTTYSLSGTTPSAIAPGVTATSTITGTSSTGYIGTVTLNSCTLSSSSVTNPNNPPTCAVTGAITFASSGASGSGTATLTTTSALGELAYPLPAGKGHGWGGAAGGVALAFLVFMGVPRRRNNWRSMLGLVVLLAALGVLSACGGGGGSGTTTTGNATSAGTYTFTVTGTGSDAAATTETTTFTLTVN